MKKTFPNRGGGSGGRSQSRKKRVFFCRMFNEAEEAAVLGTYLNGQVGLTRHPRGGLPSCPQGAPATRRPAPPPGSSGSSRAQGPILPPAVLLPVCVAALLLPGGHPEPALLPRLLPGTGSLPSSLVLANLAPAKRHDFKGHVLAQKSLPGSPRLRGGRTEVLCFSADIYPKSWP